MKTVDITIRPAAVTEADANAGAGLEAVVEVAVIITTYLAIFALTNHLIFLQGDLAVRLPCPASNALL